MTKYLRLEWEPKNKAPHDLIQRRVFEYTNRKKPFVLMENGTVLFLNDYNDIESVVGECMENLKFIPDFSVQEMNYGDFLVNIHGAIYVYVGKEEFQSIKPEVVNRLKELQFSGETFIGKENQDHLLIGLYGRAKMYRDAFEGKVHSVNRP